MKYIIITIALLMCACSGNHVKNEFVVQEVKKTPEGKFAKFYIYTYKDATLTDTAEIFACWVQCHDSIIQGDTLILQ